MKNIAILGAGQMAEKMAETLIQMNEVTAYGIASRNLEKAQMFADKFGILKAFGTYEEMLADENIDLVYIATPHSHHYKCVKMCLEVGKHVLCEKSFTVNANQTRELFSYAEQKNLFLSEAIWTRYMPSRKIIDDILKSGIIGEVTSLTANIGYELSHVKRIWEPALAGGALLDVGVYLINFARMVLGTNMTSISTSAIFKNGVDMIDNILMIFDDTKVATTQCNVNAVLNRTGCIFGTKGYIEVTNINNPEKIAVFDSEYREIKTYIPPAQITGYEYEIEACIKALEKGKIECEEMPHKETIEIMKIMDGIREDWGYQIPIVL